MIKCQEAFDKVKYALTHTPVLALPTFGEPFEVICDTSIVGIGAILLQKGQSIALKVESFPLLKNIIPLVSKNLKRLCMPCALTLLFGRCRLHGSDKPQFPHIFKITTSIVKASGPMIRVFRSKLYKNFD